ncbi:MAG: carbon monoxide dehydrogenase accessory protein CooC [bacterium]
MKIAVTGKGGVGKTTIASLLAILFAREGNRVIAIDGDPDSNLALSLGISKEEAAKITPLSELKELIQERTGSVPGVSGGIFKLNPSVDDIPERFSIEHNGVKLMVFGNCRMGGSGCYCPENAFLKNLLKHLLIQREDIVILDMEAGIEHLTRGTASSVDAFIIVVEPGLKSIQTAEKIKQLANDLGIVKIYVIGNKINSELDKDFIRNQLKGMNIIGFLSFSPKVIKADIEGRNAFYENEEIVREIRTVKDILITLK